MFGTNFGNTEDTPTSQQPPDVSVLTQQLEQARQDQQRLEQQFNDLRTHNLRATEAANQQINLLRGQLHETVTRGQAAVAPAQAASATDDWMKFLTGDTQQQGQQQQPVQQQGARLMTPDDIRRTIQEEKQREAQIAFAEARKIEELNSRFVVEHPDLAKNPAAIQLIKNQFEAVTNLRPDLPAENRYQLAIDNVKSNMLPIVGQQQVTRDKDTTKKPATAGASPYMPAIFAPPPGEKSLNDQLNMVDNRSLDQKYASRERELEAIRKQQSKLQGRG